MKKPPQTSHYRLRENARAKRVILKVQPHEGLEVVIPRGFDRRLIPEILEEKRTWIEQAWQILEAQGLSPSEPPELPERIPLPAIGKTVTVSTVRQNGPAVELIPSFHKATVTLRGAVTDRAACLTLLQEWLKRLGRHCLPPLLQRLSRETGLSYQRVQIRGQKSRWGSCSAGGTISLSWKLLFLEPPLVRTVVVHELCHTVHLNHSQDFWDLLSRLEPEALEKDAALREAVHAVPAWANWKPQEPVRK
jgi:hypothetical protein